jgi:hypothetical protein
MNHNYFVNKSGENWEVQREGAPRASFVFETQSQAILRGRRLAKQARGELTVFGTDGKIRSKDSYGKDPSRLRDTEH